MKIKGKEILKLVILFGITGVIFWYLFRDIPMAEVIETVQGFNYWWIAFSMLLGILSHFLRAWRWKLMLDANKKDVWLWNSFFAVMIGYLANSVIPRLGEITRCGIMNRKERVPVPYAIGTVITERLIDLAMLGIVTAITLFSQLNLIGDFFEEQTRGTRDFFMTNWWLFIVAGLLFLGGIWFARSDKFKKSGIFSKLQGIIKQGLDGLRSVQRTKNPAGFWLSTLGIWILYFIMLWVITLGSPETRDLGPLAGLSILVMGTLGMASPTPNGLGTFHIFVGGVLVLYGIEYDKGVIIATIMHTSQFITILLWGSLSLLLVNYLKPKTDGNTAKDQG